MHGKVTNTTRILLGQKPINTRHNTVFMKKYHIRLLKKLLVSHLLCNCLFLSTLYWMVLFYFFPLLGIYELLIKWLMKYLITGAFCGYKRLMIKSVSLYSTSQELFCTYFKHKLFRQTLQENFNLFRCLYKPRPKILCQNPLYGPSK